MATIKAYTDLEQSKKLTEILPLESADMHYFIADSLEKQEINYAVRCGTPIVKTDIPCWSLSALLSVLTYPDIKQRYDDNWVCRVENKDTTYLWVDSNPIDACVAMIEKLHKENIL